jgi:hypothetical protein
LVLAPDVAIFGDNFMLPKKFEQAISYACGDPTTIRTMRLPFPDEPTAYGRAKSGMAGLKVKGVSWRSG